MKVLSFSYCFPNCKKPDWGVFTAQRLAVLNQREEIELEVCAPSPYFPIISYFQNNILPSAENNRGLKVYHPRYFYFPRYFKKFDAKLYAQGLLTWVHNYCKKHNPDLFDAHFAWPDGTGVYYICQKLKIPYIITLRGWIWVGMYHPELWKQAIQALRGAQQIITLSESMKAVCRDAGCAEERLHTIHNGVNREIFYPVSRMQSRKKLDFPLDRPVVVSVAYFQRRKGILELIRALSRLSKDVYLVLVGAVTEEDYYYEVLQEIETLGLKKQVSLVGQQPHEKIPYYFNAANVTVLASYWEGCPNAVVESLGCGTPVIGTPVGSVPEQIIPEENGYIVPMKDPHALASALEKALNKEWDREKLAASVKSWDEVALDVYKVFEKAMSED